MTIKTDAARECAEEIMNDFCTWFEKHLSDSFQLTANREAGINKLAEKIAKHFPPSVPVQSVYAAIDAEEELSDEPPKEMQDWLEHATPDTIMEAMRIAVRQTKDGIRNRVKALIAEAK